MMDLNQKPWWTLTAVLAAQRIVQMETDYSKNYSWRRQRARRLAGMYGGRRLDTPFMRDDTFSWRTDPNNDIDSSRDGLHITLKRNKAFEYVETYVSKIGAEDAPQPALMVTDGDWDLKRRVTLNSRLLEAEYDMRQGMYANVHALAHQGLRLAAGATGSVAAKIYPWPRENRVVVELHDTLDMFLDDTELAYAVPRTYGEVTWWPPYRLAESYPDHEGKIYSAVEDRKDRGGLAYSGAVERAELVPVWEAWAVTIGEDAGRHIMCLRDGTVLVDEEWDDDEPPFAFFHSSPSMAGFWATPMMEVAYEEILKVNEILHVCDLMHTNTDKQIHYVYEPGIADINEVLNVEGVKVVRLKTPNGVVSVQNPMPFDRIDLELLHEHESGIARALGIDEMHSAAKSQPGLPSAVAQREAGSRFDNRFAATHRAYQQWVAVDIGRHMLKAQRRLYEDGTQFKRKWTGEMFSKEIDAKDVIDLDYEVLQVRIKPISEKKNTPEERVQYASELLEQGAIPFEAYIAALEHYDTPGETRVIKTQRRWVAWQIDQWLMTDDDEPVEYQGPRPWMRKTDAMVQVIDALMEAEISGAPTDRLQHFLDFIAELAAAMKMEVNPPQAPAPPLGALPPTQGAAGMDAGAQGLMAPGLVPGAAPPPAGPPAV